LLHFTFYTISYYHLMLTSQGVCYYWGT